jgi:hypothetical protein
MVLHLWAECRRKFVEVRKRQDFPVIIISTYNSVFVVPDIDVCGHGRVKSVICMCCPLASYYFHQHVTWNYFATKIKYIYVNEAGVMKCNVFP